MKIWISYWFFILTIYVESSLHPLSPELTLFSNTMIVGNTEVPNLGIGPLIYLVGLTIMISLY